MKLTRDEARLLSLALSEYKYDLLDKHRNLTTLSDKLQDLEKRLEDAGKDQRRNGRTTQDDFTDMLKRFAKNNKPVK